MTAMCLKRMVINQIASLQEMVNTVAQFLNHMGWSFASDSTPSEPANNRWAGAKISNCEGRRLSCNEFRSRPIYHIGDIPYSLGTVHHEVIVNLNERRNLRYIPFIEKVFVGLLNFKR